MGLFSIFWVREPWWPSGWLPGQGGAAALAFAQVGFAQVALGAGFPVAAFARQGATARRRQRRCCALTDRGGAALIVAVARGRDRDAAVGIFVQLVAQGADRDAENVGGMGAV